VLFINKEVTMEEIKTTKAPIDKKTFGSVNVPPTEAEKEEMKQLNKEIDEIFQRLYEEHKNDIKEELPF
jgi:hypothetical protein